MNIYTLVTFYIKYIQPLNWDPYTQNDRKN